MEGNERETSFLTFNVHQVFVTHHLRFREHLLSFFFSTVFSFFLFHLSYMLLIISHATETLSPLLSMAHIPYSEKQLQIMLEPEHVNKIGHQFLYYSPV